jgi:hypothetical protein
VKEPFALYRWCHKNATKCATWPRCGCDWYDNPTVTIDGVRKRIWFHCEHTATNKDLAYKLALANRQKYVRIAGQLEAPEREPAPRLSKYIDQIAPASTDAGRKKTRKNLLDFLAFVKDRSLDDITGSQINAWREQLLRRRSKKTGGTWSKNTVQRVYNSVKGLFSQADRDDDLAGTRYTSNPCAKLEDWSETPAVRRAWPREADWIIEALDAYFRLPLKIMRLTGCRRTEALTRTKHDLSEIGYAIPGFSPKMGWIAIPRQKKQTAQPEDRLPIPVAFVKELRAQLKHPFQQHLFGDPPPDGDTWSSQLTRAMKTLGVQHQVDTSGLCAHAIRHGVITGVQDDGASAMVAQKIGGWSGSSAPQMVQRYSRVNDKSLLVAAASIAQSYRPKRRKGAKR